MLNGRWRNELIGSGTHVWKFDSMVRSGELTLQDFMGAGETNGEIGYLSMLSLTCDYVCVC